MAVKPMKKVNIENMKISHMRSLLVKHVSCLWLVYLSRSRGTDSFETEVIETVKTYG